jgi:PAS domain S-box-containing protein
MTPPSSDRDRTLFEAVLDRMPVGIAVVAAPDGRIVFSNSRFAEVVRHPVWGSGFSDYPSYGGCHPDGRRYGADEYPVTRSLLHGETVDGEDIHYQFGDGTEGVITASSAPIRDASGAIIAAVVTVADVSQQRAAHAALEASEAHFRTLADSLAIAIWGEDGEGRIRYANRHWLEYTGRGTAPVDESALEAWGDAVHPDDLGPLLASLPEWRARGGVIRVTLRLRRHDGVYRWHTCTAVPIYDAQGRVVQRLGSATDIDDQRQAIDALQHERDLRERFVASLSHDLRSPLTAAQMGAQLLMRSADRPDRLQLQASRVIRNIERADQLIQNLLDVTRISAGEPLAVERERHDLTAIAREVVEDLTTIHGDRFVLEAPPQLPGVFDAGAIRRTLENLVGNAIKYGEPHAKVRLTLTDAPHEITLAVHNRGEPIPPEEQPLIFQPYRRARSDKQRGVGWGLGLTLVRGIAEAHGGGVQVQSSREAGTTFTVTLGRTDETDKTDKTDKAGGGAP